MSVIDNAAASTTPASSTPTSGASMGSQSSGSASQALIKAATAASSPAIPTGEATPAQPITPAGVSPTGTTQPATGAQTVVDPAQTEATRDTTPEARITAATRNAREKAYQEFGGYQPAQVREAMDLVTSIQRDPVGFITQIIKDVQAKGFQLPGLGAAPAQDSRLTDFPAPDIETTDGKIQGWSRESVIKALNFQKQQLMEELNPDLQFVRTERERSAVETQRQETRSQVADIKSHVEALPHYKENETAIAEKLRTLNTEHPDIIKRFGVPAALYRCYSEVVAEVAHKTAETKVREDFAKKAGTSIGSAHPVSTGGDAKAPQLRSQAELAAHLERLAASMSAGA